MRYVNGEKQREIVSKHTSKRKNEKGGDGIRDGGGIERGRRETKKRAREIKAESQS